MPKSLARESEPLPPLNRYLNDYAKTKRLAEHAVRGAATGAVILRPHAVYGVGDTTLLPRMLSARQMGRLFAVGDGRNRISLTHVENLAHAVVQALDPQAPPGTFNVCDEDTPSMDEMLRTILRAFGLPERIAYLPARPAWYVGALLERAVALAGRRWPPPLSRYIVALLSNECTLDISAARRDLGYRPTRSFAEGIAEVAAAHNAGSG
jgi:nucleoside-diphosphate-sugar epimerase